MGRPRTDLRARIVDAARARFLEVGVEGASLRAIAEDARTTLGMVVYHFPKKDDLFLETIEEGYARFTADLAAILGRATTSRDRLRGLFIRVGAASAKELDVIRLIAREAIGSSARRRKILRRFFEGHVPLLIAALTEGALDGELDGDLPMALRLIAVVGLGALPQLVRRGAVSARIRPLVFPPPEALADASLELIFRAIGAPARRRRSR
jgi:AcrR family transcriptional regulator